MYKIENFITNFDGTPASKTTYKAFILTKITQFWEYKLRTDAKNNSKMQYLNVNLIGLNGRCHPAVSDINTTQQVSRMRPHLKMLCGDYFTYELKAKYQGGSPNCRLCPPDIQAIENIEHILTTCQIYSDVRARVISSMKLILQDIDYISEPEQLFSDKKNLTQFILDCTSANLKIRVNYNDEKASRIFELSRGLCYSINKTRISMLKDVTNK